MNDTRFMQQQLTQGQAADAQEKARNNKEGARRAIRAAWSHVLYAVKTPDTEPGKAFDLEHLGLSTKDRNAIPVVVYDKAQADDIVKERFGAELLWLKLKDLWPAETPQLAISEVAEWFSAHAYMPKLRDRVVLETSIREAIGKFDAPFGYAEGFDQAAGRYVGLIYAKAAPEIVAPNGLLVRAEVAKQQTSPVPALPPSGSGTPYSTDFAAPKCARLDADLSGVDQAAPLLRFGRDRHEPTREGVRRDPERRRDGIAEKLRREGQADA